MLKNKRIKDLKGQKFGRLRVLEFAGYNNQRGRTQWLCKCKRGNEKIIIGKEIKSGNTKSCGCLSANMKGKKHPNYLHGDGIRNKQTRFYKIWKNIRNRCNNSNTPDYRLYGERGIKILWKDYLEFKKDMYESYLEHVEKYGENNTSIDRIDNEGNYCKENCRFATQIEQGNNRRDNIFLTHNNKTQTISQWAREINIKQRTLYKRISKGWSIEEALTSKIYTNQHRLIK